MGAIVSCLGIGVITYISYKYYKKILAGGCSKPKNEEIQNTEEIKPNLHVVNVKSSEDLGKKGNDGESGKNVKKEIIQVGIGEKLVEKKSEEIEENLGLEKREEIREDLEKISGEVGDKIAKVEQEKEKEEKGIEDKADIERRGSKRSLEIAENKEEPQKIAKVEKSEDQNKKETEKIEEKEISGSGKEEDNLSVKSGQKEEEDEIVIEEEKQNLTEKIKTIQKEIEENYEQQVNSFNGEYGGKEFYLLDEGLLNQLEILDKLQLKNYPSIREKRRSIIKKISGLLKELDKNAVRE